MSRRRRGALLIGLALALGGLAASDVGRREAAVRAQLAPLVDVVVAGRDLPPRRQVRPADLALRRIPAR
jgi:pilus assembly protein CpaB